MLPLKSLCTVHCCVIHCCTAFCRTRFIYFNKSWGITFHFLFSQKYKSPGGAPSLNIICELDRVFKLLKLIKMLFLKSFFNKTISIWSILRERKYSFSETLNKFETFSWWNIETFLILCFRCKTVELSGKYQ